MQEKIFRPEVSLRSALIFQCEAHYTILTVIIGYPEQSLPLRESLLTVSLKLQISQALYSEIPLCVGDEASLAFAQTVNQDLQFMSVYNLINSRPDFITWTHQRRHCQLVSIPQYCECCEYAALRLPTAASR
jgi:hypothetical protein